MSNNNKPNQILKYFRPVGSNSVTVTPTASGKSTFMIHPDFINLSSITLHFTATWAADTANFLQIYADNYSTIKKIKLYTREGLVLCDLDDVARYTKVCLKPNLKQEQLNCYPGNDISDSAPGKGIRRSMYDYRKRYDGTTINSDYAEPVYLYNHTSDSVDPYLNFSIDFKDIPHTIFKLNESIFIKDVLILEVEWNESKESAFLASSSTDPTADVAENTEYLELSSILISYAVERNENLKSKILEKTNSDGFIFDIDYVHLIKNTNAGTSASLINYFNSTHGYELKRIYTTCFNNTQTGATIYDISNLSSAKLVTWNTYLNDQELAIEGGTDNYYSYLALFEKYLKGSVISTYDIYLYNFFWVDEINQDLSKQLTYRFDCTKANATHRFYTFAVCSKRLQINKDGFKFI